MPVRPTIGKILGQVGAGGVVLTFLLPSVFSLLFLPHFERRSDIEANTVSKGY